ncbi:MAG: thioesterase [Desulfobulbus propionicus]|nr:MAG: thioesterase [Desulfobulbus propionicus]
MAKSFSIKLQEPIFKTTYRVIYGDTDAAGVVYNANYLRYFEIGRTEMMREWAMPYSRVEELGCVMPVTESYIRFKAPARYDDVLTIATSVAEVKRVSCRIHYAITREEDQKEKLLVKGFTTLACIDRKGKLTAFPDEVMEKIMQLTPEKGE